MDPTQFAAYVGIDWADEAHAVCLVAAHQPGRNEYQSLEQSAEAIDAWVQALRKRFAGGKIAVCLEQAKGALIYALMQYDDFVLFPINPKQLSRFRDALHPSGAKDDPADSELMLELLVKHRQQLRPWQPDDAQTRLIGLLAQDRRCLVNQRTRLTNALKSRLKQYFPLALEVLSELDQELACRFLLRWSTFDELRKADLHQIGDFYRQHHCYHARVIEKRLEKIAVARPLTRDPAVVESGQRLVRALVEQLLVLQSMIAQYDHRLAELFERHADAPIFASLPAPGRPLLPACWLPSARIATDSSRPNNCSAIAASRRSRGRAAAIV